MNGSRFARVPPDSPIVPTLTVCSPSTLNVLGGEAITLTGTGFRGTCLVWFGAARATSVVVVSSTRITCVSPASSAGPVTVQVYVTGNGYARLPNGATFAGVAATALLTELADQLVTEAGDPLVTEA
jgi:hypothetical protein